MGTPENVLPIQRAGDGAPSHDGRLGNMLVEAGKIEKADIDKVMALQRAEGLRFGEAAVRLALITPRDVHSAVAKQFRFSYLPDPEPASAELVAAYAPHHERAEELRTLRTQLLIRWYNAGVRQRMLAIASPCRGEGRSYIAANLAVVFAQLGERTLLIDADLRTPRQHRIFNVSDRVGLSSLLSCRADRSAVVPVPGFDSLALLPAGPRPPNPQELLLRPLFTALLEELSGEFDVILFDTPPAKAYADAQSLALRAGNVMVMARKDHTRISDTNRLIRDLNDTGTNIIGTLFNVF